MKKTTHLVNLFILLLGLSFLALSCEKSKPNQPQGKAQTQNQTDLEKFLPLFKKMSQDQSRQKEYQKVVDELADLVTKEVQKNPELFYPLLQTWVEIAIKSSPGMAIEFEDYASSKTREEMERVRKEYNTEKFESLEKQITALKQENAQFQEVSGQKDQLTSLVAETKEQLFKAKEQISALTKENEQFQEVSRQKDQLTALVAETKEQLSQTKEELKKKEEETRGLKTELGKLRAKLNIPTSKEVPVALVNYTNLNKEIKFISLETNQIFLFTASSGFFPGKLSVFTVPPGDYMVECHYESDHKNWGKPIKKTVTKEPYVFYEGKQYHCLIRINNVSYTERESKGLE